MIGLAFSVLFGAGAMVPPPPITSELVPPETGIDVSLMLKLPDKQINADVKAGRLAKSDMTPGALSDRYGPSPELFNRLKGWLESGGLQVPETEGAGRLIVSGHGTVAQVNKLFTVRLHLVKGEPPSIHAPDAKPSLPGWVQDAVKTVVGLDNRPVKVKVPKKYQDR